MSARLITVRLHSSATISIVEELTIVQEKLRVISTCFCSATACNSDNTIVGLTT